MPIVTPKPNQKPNKDTSWTKSSGWYDALVGDKGHFYHQEVIFPKLLPLMNLKSDSAVLDLGCGQGVFSRQIPEAARYIGIDFSKPLIQEAQRYAQKAANRLFVHHDLTDPAWPLDSKMKGQCTHIVSILAIQNMCNPEMVLTQAKQFLRPDGQLFLVLNHPCFRIPRQSSWGWDEAGKTQTRVLSSYMSDQEIPITMHPGKAARNAPAETTWSYHFPLSRWSQMIASAGLCCHSIHEWISPKVSTGKNARPENRARQEFPLFLTFVLGPTKK